MTSSSDSVRRSLKVDGLPPPTGPYAWAVSYGDMIFVSGLRGLDTTSGAPVDGDQQRLELIFAHLAQILASHGSAQEHVLATRVYVTDMRRLRPLVNEAFARFFQSELPTRTIVEVAGLNQDDSVEIEVIAARPGATARAAGTRPDGRGEG